MKRKSVGAGVGLALAVIVFNVALLISMSSSAAPLQPQAAQASTASNSGAAVSNPPRSEVLVVHIPFHSAAERDRLANEWGAEEANTLGGYITVWTDRPGYNKMLAAGLKVTIDEGTTKLANDTHLFGSKSPNTFYGGYKTVEEMQTFLDQEVAAYPTLAQKVYIGQSWCATHTCTLPNSYNGYNLYVLHITNQNIAGPKPVYWFDTGIHAREIAVPEIAMLYIDYLLSNYNSNADAHWLVDYQDIWVMPMVNPDGHHIVEAGGGGSSPYYQRKNANNTNGCTTWPPSVSNQFGTDNNRNFDFQWNCCGGSSGQPCSQTYHGTGGASDPETVAVENQVRSLIADQRGPNITDPAPITTTGVYQNMHSNASLNLYPWGFQTGAAPNGLELANIGAHIKATNAYPPGNNYTSCQPPNCLYAVDGDAIDWAYGELGAASFTTEVGGNDFLVPLAYTTGTLWPLNRGALLYEAKLARTPYLLAHGPDTSNVATNPMTVTQGMTSSLSATINYAWSGNNSAQNVGAAEYYVDTPPWAGGTAIAMSGSFGGSQTVNASAIVDTSALAPGRHILLVRGRGVTDYQGYQTWGPITAVFLDVLPNGGPTPTPGSSTNTPVATSTATPMPPTATSVPATNTPPPTMTPAATSTSIPPTLTPILPTLTPIATSTPIMTSTPLATNTPGGPTNTPAPTNTPGGPTNTPVVPTVTPTDCPNPFVDINNNVFYTAIHYLYCRGVVNGTDPTHYSPGGTSTRAQFAKVVVLGFALPSYTPSGGGHDFTDVPNTYWAYSYIEAGFHAGILSGFDAANCTSHGATYPCYLPNLAITRGQLTKLVVRAGGYPPFTPTGGGQDFSDVPPTYVFYVDIETAFHNSIIAGYPDGTFRPNNNIRRDEMAQIVYEGIIHRP